MRLLTRYIAKQLLAALLIIAFSLTAIIWLTQALRFIDFIVNRGVSTLTFLELTGLMLPSLLFVILPFAVFVSVLFVYQRLYSDSELVVLRSAGLSRWQLLQPVWVVVGMATLFCYLLSLYFMPLTYRKFKDMQSFLRDNYASLLLQEEVFNSPVKGLTVFIRKRQNDGLLEGILVHDNRNPERPVTMMAQQGRLETTEAGPRFLLYNGNRQELRNQRFSFLKFDEYAVDLSFYASEVVERKRKPEELYLPELLSHAQDTQQGELIAELHHRLSWPLYVLVLGLFGFAVLLRGEFNRRGQAKRITRYAFSALAIVATALGLQNIVPKYPDFWWIIYVNLGMWLAFAIWLITEPRIRLSPSSQEQVV